MKKAISLFLIAVLCLMSVPDTASAAVKINKKKVTLQEGKSTTLKITGTKKAVKWTSSDKKVATVTKKGKVKAISGGKAIITAKIGSKKYKCTVTVRDNKETLQYQRDLAERDYIDRISESVPSRTLDPDTEYEIIDDDKKDKDPDAELDAKISNLLKTGFASSKDLDTELGKAYLEFCNTWISETELESMHKIRTVWDWPDNQLYLLIGLDDKYIIEGTPKAFVSGEVYTNGILRYQYLEKFERDGEYFEVKQYFVNREDLKNKGIIK